MNDELNKEAKATTEGNTAADGVAEDPDALLNEYRKVAGISEEADMNGGDAPAFPQNGIAGMLGALLGRDLMQREGGAGFDVTDLAAMLRHQRQDQSLSKEDKERFTTAMEEASQLAVRAFYSHPVIDSLTKLDEQGIPAKGPFQILIAMTHVDGDHTLVRNCAALVPAINMARQTITTVANMIKREIGVDHGAAVDLIESSAPPEIGLRMAKHGGLPGAIHAASDKCIACDKLADCPTLDKAASAGVLPDEVQAARDKARANAAATLPQSPEDTGHVD